MLLRSVLAAFLDNLPNERALDLPFLALLADMGFEDVHFTHGPMEFGKDFIAKRREGDRVTQYVFQSKAGNLTQGGWRDVMPQMLEAVVSGLSHPAFDKLLPQQAVLVLSGRLTGNAPLGFQDFNLKLESDYKKQPVDLWDRERLVEYFLQHGPDSFYSADAQGLQAFGSFLTCYGDAIRGSLTGHGIERHSRAWVGRPAPERMFEGALEAELLAAACARAGRRYEALVCILAYLRSTLAALHSAGTMVPTIAGLHSATIARLAQMADEYVVAVQAVRTESDGLLAAMGVAMGEASIVSYPVSCARAMEIAALSYLTGSGEQRSRAERCLLDVVAEPGAAHPVSDRNAVSQVLAALALTASGQLDVARALVRGASVWVADRYEEGAGLAEFDASPVREVEFLLGYPFEGVGVEPRTSSLLATALCDLAAFLGETEFFADVVNEFSAVGVAFQYFQAQDTPGQFLIEGRDVIQYPNVEYGETVGTFADFAFGNHVETEPRSFRLAETAGVSSYAALMLLLRDRYFPSLWPVLVAAKGPGPGTALPSTQAL